jgi:uncharacterized YccA/Bax inhibitor family protein
MGTWMGAISQMYEQVYDGIVGQAVFALRVPDREAHQAVRGRGGGATVGIGLLYLVAWLLSLFGADLVFLSTPTPLGIGLSIAIWIVAALNLILDFGVIEAGATAGAPREMEWLAAFGLVSTLVWLYLEILRLLALLARER